MKLKLITLFILVWAEVLIGQTWFALPINSGGQIGPAGTNMIKTNIVAGTNILVQFGTNGEATINVVSSGGMSVLASNFFKMGISNILAANGIALATNGGVLWITNTSTGAGITTNATQFAPTVLLTIKPDAYVTNIHNFGNLTNTGGDFWLDGSLNLSGNILGFTGPPMTIGFGDGTILNYSGLDIWPNDARMTLGSNTPFSKIYSTNFIGNGAGLTNLAVLTSATLTNLANNPYKGYTNLAMQVAANNVLSNIQGMISFYWTNAQASSMILSNIVGMASFYWTNSQASSMVLSNMVGLSDITFTNVPLGGTNISVRTIGGTNFIDTIGQLNNWSQLSTNNISNLIGATNGLDGRVTSLEVNLTSSMVATNFVINTIYTNTTVDPVLIRATIYLVTAAVNGDSSLDLMYSKTGGTNYTLIGRAAIATTITGALALPFTNDITGVITNQGNYYFTNTSSGIGNSSGLVNGTGQLTTFGGQGPIGPIGATGPSSYIGEVSVTNATRMGWVFDQNNGTNRLRSIQAGNGLVLTNQSTNIMVAIDPLVVASQSDLIAATNSSSVTNWINTRQLSSANLTNLSNLVNPANPGIGFFMMGSINGPLWISPDTGWWPIIDEEFLGDPTQLNTGLGRDIWSRTASGNVPGTTQTIIAYSYEDGLCGIWPFWTTQSTTGISISGGGPTSGQNQIGCTNIDLFCVARIRIGQTNIVGDLSSIDAGVANSAGGAGTTDPTDGIWIHTTTNVNNQFELITARASTRTVSAPWGNIIQYAWTNIAWYLDSSGTNVISYIGSSVTNLVPMATNTANIPNSVLCSYWVRGRRTLTSGGTANRTNYIDYYRLWARRHSY